MDNATPSGKAVGSIIPNLLTAEQSILCIDPRRENTRATLDARRRMGPVHVLDPFGITGQPSAAHNPLDPLGANSLELAEDAALVAEALVYDPPGQIGEAHWNEEAKALIVGIILHVVTDGEEGTQSLGRVRELLTLPPDRFRVLLAQMQASLAADGLVRRAANRHLGKSEREASGVISSAQRHTHFLDSARLRRVLARSDFRFDGLKESLATVFLVLPPERLHTHARWLRLIVVQALLSDRRRQYLARALATLQHAHGIHHDPPRPLPPRHARRGHSPAPFAGDPAAIGSVAGGSRRRCATTPIRSSRGCSRHPP